jgi:hypothetical protein
MVQPELVPPRTKNFGIREFRCRKAMGDVTMARIAKGICPHGLLKYQTRSTKPTWPGRLGRCSCTARGGCSSGSCPPPFLGRFHRLQEYLGLCRIINRGIQSHLDDTGRVVLEFTYKFIEHWKRIKHIPICFELLNLKIVFSFNRAEGLAFSTIWTFCKQINRLNLHFSPRTSTFLNLWGNFCVPPLVTEVTINP